MHPTGNIAAKESTFEGGYRGMFFCTCSGQIAGSLVCPTGKIGAKESPFEGGCRGMLTLSLGLDAH